MAHADDMARTAATGDIVHMELYRASVGEPLWWYGVALRYVQSIAKGKQILVLSMMAQSPFRSLRAWAKRNCACRQPSCWRTIARAPLFARYYPDQVDQAAWARVYERFAEAEALAPYLRDRQSIPYVALLYSQTSVERFDYRDGKPSHLGEIKGFAKALLQEKILFDVITEADLCAGIGQYQVLILPNASCLSAKCKAAVRAFVAAGGGVIASYETGMYDDTGQRDGPDDLARVLGVQYSGETLPFELDIYMQMTAAHQLPVDMPAGKRLPTMGMQVVVEPEGAQAVAHVQGASEVHYGPLVDKIGPPVVLTNTSGGNGKSVLFTTPIGVRYLEFGIPDFRKLIAFAVNWTAATPSPVRVRNASDVLAVTAFKQGERTLIHLVNSIRDETRLPINETIPSTDIEIEIDLDISVKSVVARGDETDVSWVSDGATLRVKVAKISYHVLLVIE